MNPLTHLFVGWTLLERALPERRDKALVVLSGLAPDLDGLGIVVDFATRQLGLVPTDFYQSLHRVYGHGLPAALVIAALVAMAAKQRLRAAALALVAVHLHFVCDLLGSRGNGPEDYWPIWYLAPFSMTPEWSWSGQWPLVGWQNTAISIALMLVIAARACRHGYSPVVLVSASADLQVVATFRRWRDGARALLARGR